MGMIKFLVVLILAHPAAYGLKNSASYLDLDLRQDRYLGEVQHSTQESNYTQGLLQLNLEPTQPKRFPYKLNARGLGTFEMKEESYFGVPEAYLEYAGAPVRLSVGRKKRTWSRLDEEFHLGIWQPELRWDYLAPTQQGLLGVFLDFTFSSEFHLVLFTSPLNLPDQGPSYRLEKGQFYSSNRWFQQPSGFFRLFNGTSYASDVPLYFDIDKPANDELFMQASFGGAIEFDSDSGFWSHLSYAYKPRNQIHLGIECSNCGDLSAPTPLEATVVIHPKIVKHHVLSWESGFDRVDDRGWFSLTAEIPNRSGFPDAYEEAPLDDVLISGLAYQHYLGDWIGGRPSWMQMSYLRVFDLNQKAQGGVLKEDQVKSSLDRYPLRNVVALDWKIRLSQKSSSRLHWTNRYQYSIPEEGGWLSSQLEWSQGPVNWSLGCDIMGSEVDSSSEKAGLFTRYRANDRVFGGVGYVF